MIAPALELETIPARLSWHHADAPIDLDVPLVDGAIDDAALAALVELPPLVRAIYLEPVGGTEVGILAWLVLDVDTEQSLGLLDVTIGAGA